MGNGSVLLVIAMTLTPGVDALAKVLGATHTPFQVTFLRFLAAGIVALCTARILKIPVVAPTRSPVRITCPIRPFLGTWTGILRIRVVQSATIPAARNRRNVT